MPELTFVGAAGVVTGSKHLLSLDGGYFMVDCGLFQGPPQVEALNAVPLPVEPSTIGAIAVTHGHLDHVGYLPKIVHDGFRGPIYCTPATADIAEIVLEDAGKLQRHMHDRGFHHERSHGVPMTYDDRDLAAVLRMFRAVPLETDVEIPGGRFRYHEAGHIIGAAFVEVNAKSKRIVFSGDLGRYGALILNDPAPLPAADLIVCEATYGGRDHAPDRLETLAGELRDGIRRGGVIVIPAFAVERTQEILYSIGLLQKRDPEIAAVGVHVDSPMAAKVDAVFEHHREAYKALPESKENAFGCRNLAIHVTSEDSKRLNHIAGPAIVITSSGMATGGRVLFHLHRHLADPTATILFPGYQVPGTLGRRLLDGVTPVRIFGDSLPVRAKIVHLGGFSAHADRSELLRWLATCPTKPPLFAVHAEPESAAAFVAAVRADLGFDASVAHRGATYSV